MPPNSGHDPFTAAQAKINARTATVAELLRPALPQRARDLGQAVAMLDRAATEHARAHDPALLDHTGPYAALPPDTRRARVAEARRQAAANLGAAIAVSRDLGDVIELELREALRPSRPGLTSTDRLLARGEVELALGDAAEGEIEAKAAALARQAGANSAVSAELTSGWGRQYVRRHGGSETAVEAALRHVVGEEGSATQRAAYGALSASQSIRDLIAAASDVAIERAGLRVSTAAVPGGARRQMIHERPAQGPAPSVAKAPAPAPVAAES